MNDLVRTSIKEFVKLWEESHPLEVSVLVSNKKEITEHSKNTFASSDTMRHALEMPPDLYRKLDKSYPELFKSKDNLHWFMKEFKLYCVPERI
jgi:hypothetical protein